MKGVVGQTKSIIKTSQMMKEVDLINQAVTKSYITTVQDSASGEIREIFFMCTGLKNISNVNLN
ncbi:hypothetical protein [Dehalobacter sp. 4CP]|uniref:hypothetical protein n=1 Tax=Dehalobacter sp. CP TaxID=2594474 RepID=UPI0039E782E7